VPINKRLYEEMQAKREAEHSSAERDRRRALILSGLACLAWAFLGLVVFAFAFHTTDAGMAEIYRWAAYVVTYGGVSFTLLRAYRAGEKRGDW
jgi:amino acid transporter